MATQPKNNHKNPRTSKKAAARLPHICANCGRWSWKSGCRHDKNAAPSKSCGRFEMGRFASYAIDTHGKVVKIDPATYSGEETFEASLKKSSSTDWVVCELKRRDIACIDERDENPDTGCLWVVGGHTAVMQQLADEFANMGAELVFVEDGNEVTAGRPAWRLSGYPQRK